MHSLSSLHCHLIHSAAQLSALCDEWRTLAKDTLDLNAVNLFTYAVAACRQLDLASEELCVVVVRGEERAVCIWPMVLQRQGGITVARHLSGGSNEEYCDPLVGDGPDAEAATAMAVKALKSVADVVILYNLKPHGRAAQALERTGGFKHRQPIECFIVKLAGHADFQAWSASKSQKFRWQLRQGRKWLEAKGSVRFRQVLPSEAGPFVDWILARKQELVDSLAAGESWTRSREAHAFYAEMLARPFEETGVVGFALEFDGRIIAGCVCLVSEALEYFVTAYDEAYAKASPGALLLEEVAKFAIEQGKDLDLRVMEAEYKSRWSDRREPRTSYTMALTARGNTVVARAFVDDAVRRAWRSTAGAIRAIRASLRAANRSRWRKPTNRTPGAAKRKATFPLSPLRPQDAGGGGAKLLDLRGS